MPAALVRGLAESVAENMSLYDVLQNCFGLRLAKPCETYFMLPAEAAAAELLGVPVAAPMFSAERVTLFSTGRAFEFVQSILRGDLYCINLELVADRSPPAIREQEIH